MLELMPRESGKVAHRLRVSAKLLRAFGQGAVGDARHWAKDCAADCDSGAGVIDEMYQALSDLVTWLGQPPSNSYRIVDLKDAAVTALAKARGETP